MKKFITAIYAIPTTSQSPNAFKLIEKLVHHLGLFNCDLCNDAAAVAYEGIIPEENKQKLIDIAKKDDYTLIFIEAEENTKWIKYETVHVPNDEEMKEHLAWS